MKISICNEYIDSDYIVLYELGKGTYDCDIPDELAERAFRIQREFEQVQKELLVVWEKAQDAWVNA